MEEEARPNSWVRDHLANERTLLAWIRTALAFMAFGLGIAKIGLFLSVDAVTNPDLADSLPSPIVSAWVGALLILAGGVISVAGAIQVRRWSLEVKGPQPSLIAPFLTAALAIVTSLGLVIYVLS